MRAIVYNAPHTFALRDIPTPVPGPGEVRVKVLQVGLCGTDLHLHNGRFLATFPFIPGHEVVGHVDELGSGVTGLRALGAGVRWRAYVRESVAFIRRRRGGRGTSPGQHGGPSRGEAAGARDSKH
jgi:D-arabinose 1-dehydrogenase-like Zn-dependent alcohol dehydrogenase